MTKEEKLKKAHEAIKSINKEYGEKSVTLLGDKPEANIDAIPSGSIGLDLALGIGGYAKGRIIEVFGGESSGKTTLCLHAIAETQKKGGLAAIIDAENSLDIVYARALGVNVDELFISQPSSGEEGLNIAQKLVESECYDIIVIDSVAALVPKAEIEADMEQATMGVQARMMSKALRKLTAMANKNKCSIIFINQLREKIGIMFGNPSTTTGGKALQFFASMRLEVSRSLTAENSVMSGKEKIGNKTKVNVIKNKLAPPFKIAEFDIIYGIGIDKFGELIDLAVKFDIIKRTGAWYNYKDQKLQGLESVKQLLSDNPELTTELEKEVKSLIYEK